MHHPLFSWRGGMGVWSSGTLQQGLDRSLQKRGGPTTLQDLDWTLPCHTTPQTSGTGIKGGGSTFSPVSDILLPFCLTNCPQFWTFASLQIQASVYINNWLIWEKSQNQLVKNTDHAVVLTQCLGFSIYWGKSLLIPSPHITYLRVEWEGASYIYPSPEREEHCESNRIGNLQSIHSEQKTLLTAAGNFNRLDQQTRLQQKQGTKQQNVVPFGTVRPTQMDLESSSHSRSPEHLGRCAVKEPPHQGRISQTTFNKIASQIHLYINLFVHPGKTKLPLFGCLFPHPAAALAEALAVDWNRWEVIYILPPVYLIQLCLQKLEDFSGSALFIVLGLFLDQHLLICADPP